jgi:KaiC/GvpD/RAD55 family RecA-like ATPase/5S rRNA maturation endonuclease (ribonuclease M5)
MSKLQIPILTDIQNVIKEKGIEYKEDGGKNYIFKVCPICGDDHEHFYLGVSHENLGLWNCFKCSGEPLGNVNKVWSVLKDHIMGEATIISAPMKVEPKSKNNQIPRVLEYHQELLSDKETLSYLINTRKINVDTIQKYKLGIVNMQPPNWDSITKFLCIPHFFKNSLMNAKFRSLPPAKKGFTRIPGAASILFNYDNIDVTKQYIYVCEGELDAITLAQAGESNVVSITVGAKSFNPDWFDLLNPFKIIYIVLDNDLAGQEGANTLADRLGRDKCYNVLLPKSINNESVKDINDYFKYADIDEFKTLTLKANKFVLPTLYTMDTVITELESRMINTGKMVEGLDTPWPGLNDKLGPIAKGDLVYLSGRPKRAKTTLAMNMCHYYSYEKGIPSLLFCLEMMPERIGSKLVCYHRKVDYDRVTVEDLQMTRTDFNYRNAPFYLGYTADPKYLEVDALFKLFELAHRKYGIEFFVFDNLQFLSRSITNTAQEISRISRQFKLMAMNLNCQFMVIVQPKRIADDQVMTSSHLKDSSAMEADADHVIINHRKSYADILVNSGGTSNQDTLSPIVIVTVDRSRFSSGGATSLYLEGAQSYLRPATEDEIISN